MSTATQSLTKESEVYIGKKDSTLQQIGLLKQDTDILRMKANLFLCSHIKQFKIHQRPSLNLRMKVLEENRSICKGPLKRTQTAQEMTQELTADNWDYMKLKSFSTAKEMMSRVKTETTEQISEN